MKYLTKGGVVDMSPRKRCPEPGCSRYMGTHTHIQPERSSEREQTLHYLIEVPFYGNDEKAKDFDVSLARMVATGVGSGIKTARLQVWDEQDMPDDADIYVRSDIFISYEL